MDISAVSQTGIMYSPTVKATETAPEPETVDVTVAVEENENIADDDLVVGDENVAEDDAVEDDDGNDFGRCHGVWRLLQSGHFRGAADVRHRIRFADRIAEMREQKAAQIADEGVEDILETTAGRISALVESGTLDENAIDAVNASTGEFTMAMFELSENYTGDSAALAEQLQTNFESLVTNLQAALTPTAETEEPIVTEPSETIVTNAVSLSISTEIKITTQTVTSQQPVSAESPADIPSVTEPAVEEPLVDQPAGDEPAIVEPETSAFEEFFTQLTATFESSLADLVKSLDNVRVLPEMHRPHGHGRAFSKFLAMYEKIMADISHPPGEDINTEG